MFFAYSSKQQRSNFSPHLHELILCSILMKSIEDTDIETQLHIFTTPNSRSKCDD